MKKKRKKEIKAKKCGLGKRGDTFCSSESESESGKW